MDAEREQAAGQLVLQIAAQDAIFDEHILLGGVAFVVDIERAAAAADGAVVDHGAECAGDFLADAAAESGDLLAVEVGFEAVADGFVQEDAGPAGTEDHGHFAGGRVDGSEHGNGLAGGLAREMLGSFFVEEEIEFDASAAAGVAALGLASVVAGGGPDAHAGHRLAIEGQDAVAGGDQDVAQAIDVDGLHLKDAGIVGAGGAVGALDQFDAVGEGGIGGCGEYRIEIMVGAFVEVELVDFGGAGGDIGSDARGFADLFGGEVVTVGVAGPFAGDDADADAQGDALGGALTMDSSMEMELVARYSK